MPPGMHPVIWRVYRARGVCDPGELDVTAGALLPADALKGMSEAVDILAEVLTGGGRIVVVGDFDADGATSCAVAMRALKAMGAADPMYLVPNRFDYGYGLSPEIVQLAAALEPALLVTVDNGISSLEGVEAANALGIPVIVTDHHLPGERLPDAAAIVNPNQPGCSFPSKALAGVGVIFYVMAALRTRLRDTGWFESRGRKEPNLAELLDVVALGTVADVVPLDRNNRILVEQGIRRIRAGRACPGIGVLLTLGGRDPARVVASDLGFAVGPRLNAAGRLEDMGRGIRCLLADTAAEALELAQSLDDLNRQRRDIEGQMQEEALAGVEALAGQMEGAPLPAALCIADDRWHQGVIGILASRIKERFHRPVIAFAPSSGDEWKGSGRSIPGLHLRDALDAVATANPGLIPKFGGHAMAAGLSLGYADLERFRAAFETAVSERVTADDLQGVVYTDGELAADDLTLEFAREVRREGPWGQGFPEPTFDGVFEILDRRVVGTRHLKMVLAPAGGDSFRRVDAIAFGAVDYGWERLEGAVRLIYRVDVNAFRGKESLQLMVQHMEAAPLHSTAGGL